MEIRMCISFLRAKARGISAFALTCLIGTALLSMVAGCQSKPSPHPQTAQGKQNSAEVLPPPSKSPDKSPDELLIDSVEKYCAAVEEHGGKKEADFIVGVSSQGSANSNGWRLFHSENELQKTWEEEGNKDAAFVWLNQGKINSTNFTLQSGSGDWALYTHHCFRQDGTVARIESELRTFNGNMIARRKWIFDPNGEKKKFTEEFLDLNTEKPKQPDADFEDRETPLCRKVTDLPFYGIFQSKGRLQGSPTKDEKLP